MQRATGGCLARVLYECDFTTNGSDSDRRGTTRRYTDTFTPFFPSLFFPREYWIFGTKIVARAESQRRSFSNCMVVFWNKLGNVSEELPGLFRQPPRTMKNYKLVSAKRFGTRVTLLAI